MATVILYLVITLCALCVGALAYGLYDLANIINEIYKRNH